MYNINRKMRYFSYFDIKKLKIFKAFDAYIDN